MCHLQSSKRTKEISKVDLKVEETEKKKRERDLNLGLKVSFASYLLGNANKTVTMIALTAIIS